MLVEEGRVYKQLKENLIKVISDYKHLKNIYFAEMELIEKDFKEREIE